MDLIRCKDQKSATLEDFYTKNSHDISGEGGKAMLDLIAGLRALPDDRRVFGLTSHQRLCLLAKDTYTSSWFVIIAALDKRNYFIEYLMTDDVAPWQNAYVRGETRSKERAIEMILIGMAKSRGWIHAGQPE